MGARLSAPGPRARASGSMPKIMDREGLAIGRSLVRAAFCRAAFRSTPAARCCLVKSTSNMAFLLTNPISMMMPIIDMRLRSLPTTSRPKTAPITAIGKDSGTGLALAVCYSIASRHNAAIRIETGPAGTTFYFTFTPE